MSNCLGSEGYQLILVGRGLVGQAATLYASAGSGAAPGNR